MSTSPKGGPKGRPFRGHRHHHGMVSALTDTPVKPGLAMTGEVTLRGRVLAIGGLREKTMAALRNGIKTVIVPAENEKDLEEIDQTVRAALHFILVEQVDQVLAAALSLSGTACERDTEQGDPSLQERAGCPSA